MSGSVDRAILFVDGNNWYHGCRSLGLAGLGRMDFTKVSRKLVGPRQWRATRYYVGRVPRKGTVSLADEQDRSLAFQASRDPRFSHHFGRIEEKRARSRAAIELKRYLASLKIAIDTRVFHDLIAIANAYAETSVMVEKAVDVQIAIDMVLMAERAEFETAYLLSADGDLTPAVEAVRATGRKVFVASPTSGARLAAACESFFRLKKGWFHDVIAS